MHNKKSKNTVYVFPSSYTAFKATITAAGATNLEMFVNIGPMYVPTAGRASKPAAPVNSNAIAAIKKLYTSFADMFKKPMITPRITKTITIVSAYSVPSIGSPAIIAIITPRMKDQCPICSNSIITPYNSLREPGL